MARKIFKSGLILGWVFLLSACGLQGNNKPSVLLVAVDFLGYEMLSCEEDKGNVSQSGFATFCAESVRFTHAYTPSTMATSAMASILTARYPADHKVWHNGRQFLASEITTVAEVAKRRGFNTSFFSGGPPIWSKSGLGQGFEMFNDHIDVELNHFYRPARENFKFFMNWLDTESYKEPFFSTVYLPDLQFPDITTTDSSNEIRSRTRQSQVNEVDESLAYLIKELKKRNRWKSTYVILVGLSGPPNSASPKENSSFALKTKNTLVSLYIKPPRKARDLPINWTIDSNVTLVDLGVTLFDIFEEPSPTPKEASLEVTSLIPVLGKPSVTWNEDRMILTESAWPQWRNISRSRFAVRKGYYLGLYDEELKIYNTLIDRNESNPLPKSDPVAKELSKEMVAYFQKQQIAPWAPPDSQIIDKLYIGRRIFSDKVYGKLVKNALKLSKERYWDDQLAGWVARYFMVKNKWKSMNRLGKQMFKPLWSYVALRNLKKTARAPKKGCGKYFNPNQNNFKRPRPNECDDSLFVSTLAWTLSKKQVDRDKNFEKFWRSYRQVRLEQRIAAANYKNDLRWDVSVNRPTEPSHTELYLSLPRNKPFKEALEKRIAKYIEDKDLF